MRRRLLRWIVPDLAREMEAVLDRFEAASIPAGTMNFALDVVRLIETEHPEWLGTNKRSLCHEAIARFIERKGGKAKDSIVNVITELAVSVWKAEPGHYQSH